MLATTIFTRGTQVIKKTKPKPKRKPSPSPAKKYGGSFNGYNPGALAKKMPRAEKNEFGV